MGRTQSAARHFSARNSMKLVSLILALGLVGMMGVMLVAMSGVASAQSPLTTKARLANASTPPLNEPSANFIENATRFDRETLASERPRENPQKRSRNRCSRISTICGSAARLGLDIQRNQFRSIANVFIATHGPVSPLKAIAATREPS